MTLQRNEENEFEMCKSQYSSSMDMNCSCHYNYIDLIY